MNIQYASARGLLSQVVKELAVAPGPVNERLLRVWRIIQPLTPVELPQELRNDWQSIKDEITKYPTLIDPYGNVIRSSIEQTLCKIRRKTASKIAEKIYSLYWNLENNEYD
ncbi:MAG: hypothetical protein HY272_12650 [Gammaproteobacteria bacterium]|nr:hypothetical protein [Gammaproteobacteria bacterium]